MLFAPRRGFDEALLKVFVFKIFLMDWKIYGDNIDKMRISLSLALCMSSLKVWNNFPYIDGKFPSSNRESKR